MLSYSHFVTLKWTKTHTHTHCYGVNTVYLRKTPLTMNIQGDSGSSDNGLMALFWGHVGDKFYAHIKSSTFGLCNDNKHYIQTIFLIELQRIVLGIHGTGLSGF